MGSLFLPDHFQPEVSSLSDIKVASIAWGFQLGFSLLTGAKAGAQTVRIYRRVHRVTPYLALMWIEILANILLGTLSWLYLVGLIAPSFAFFFILVTCWCLELQCLIQIIRNRISLLIHSPREKFWLKWLSFLIVLGINISVYCIWMPARLQISPFWIRLNNIWDRIEKVIFLLVDGGLNVYFIVLVKRKLLQSGVTKYYPLFWFNIAMVVVSLSLDAVLIGLMSLRNGLIYAQFHPVVYTIKLNIEMSMAALISKIARSADGSTPSGPSAPGEIKLTNPGRNQHNSSQQKKSGKNNHRYSTNGTGRMYNDKDEAKKRFDPTVSEIAGEVGGAGGERMYHAWVSADGRRFSNANHPAGVAVRRGGEEDNDVEAGRGGFGGYREFGYAVGSGGSGGSGGNGSGSQLNQIRKETEVHIMLEEEGPKREPSEDGSTARLT